MARGRKATVVIPRPVAHGGTKVGEPPGLSPGAREKWADLLPKLGAVCDLKPTDADAIAQYCEAWALRQKALAELHAGGVRMVHETPNGALQINPLITIARQQEQVMMRLSERFGLDPASRQRLKVGQAGAGTDDEFGDFLKDAPSGRGIATDGE